MSEEDPGRWARYDKMMAAREPVDFDSPYTCRRCGRRRGDHLTEQALKRNPRACRFTEKFYPSHANTDFSRRG